MRKFRVMAAELAEEQTKTQEATEEDNLLLREGLRQRTPSPKGKIDEVSALRMSARGNQFSARSANDWDMTDTPRKDFEADQKTPLGSESGSSDSSDSDSSSGREGHDAEKKKRGHRRQCARGSASPRKGEAGEDGGDWAEGATPEGSSRSSGSASSRSALSSPRGSASARAPGPLAEIPFGGVHLAADAAKATDSCAKPTLSKSSTCIGLAHDEETTLNGASSHSGSSRRHYGTGLDSGNTSPQSLQQPATALQQPQPLPRLPLIGGAAEAPLSFAAALATATAEPAPLPPPMPEAPRSFAAALATATAQPAPLPPPGVVASSPAGSPRPAASAAAASGGLLAPSVHPSPTRRSPTAKLPPLQGLPKAPTEEEEEV